MLATIAFQSTNAERNFVYGGNMAGLDLIIMRSKTDPSLYVVTERSRYRSAMDSFHTTDPDDSLIHVPMDRAELLLRKLSELPSVQMAINTDGLYRHRTD